MSGSVVYMLLFGPLALLVSGYMYILPYVSPLALYIPCEVFHLYFSPIGLYFRVFHVCSFPLFLPGQACLSPSLLFFACEKSL